MKRLTKTAAVAVCALALISAFAYFAPGKRLRTVIAQGMPPAGSFGFLLHGDFSDPANEKGGAVLPW